MGLSQGSDIFSSAISSSSSGIPHSLCKGPSISPDSLHTRKITVHQHLKHTLKNVYALSTLVGTESEAVQYKDTAGPSRNSQVPGTMGVCLSMVEEPEYRAGPAFSTTPPVFRSLQSLEKHLEPKSYRVSHQRCSLQHSSTSSCPRDAAITPQSPKVQERVTWAQRPWREVAPG